MTRSNLVWMVLLISAISSKNRVPWCASSNRPALFSTAPVKAPFSWPNSSLSSRFSDRLPQNTGIKSLSRREEWKCSARATNSLPVPLSPSIKTDAVESATSRTISNIFKIGVLFPIISGKTCCREASFFNRWFSDCSCSNSWAFSMAIAAWPAKAFRNWRLSSSNLPASTRLSM